MTAQAQEATTQDRFTAADFADVITFEVAFKHLYGERKFEFGMRIETDDDTAAMREFIAGRKVSNHAYNVERLARLIDRAPTGISDFPEGRPDDAARKYFAPKKFTRFLQEALLRYDAIQTSDQRLFL